MKALKIERFGPLENLQVRDVQDPPLPSDCVRIEVEAAGVNPSDTGVALGRFAHATLPRILGRDYAGKIIEGPQHLIGTPVWGSGGGLLGLTQDGSHAERMLLPIDAVIARPPHLSAEEAAVTGVPFVTAWSALVELATFRTGEWAIVSGAAGAVGAATVGLVKALGGHAIALVLSGTDPGRLDGLGVDAVLRSDVDDVPAAVFDLTSGRGADVALNAVGAPVFAMLAASLALDGRMVIFSAARGKDVTFDLFTFYRRRFRFFGLDTAAFDLTHIARVYEKFGPLFESRAVSPPPIGARFPLVRAREAYERVAAGEPGKVVIIPGEPADAEAESAGATASRSKSDAGSPGVLA